MSAGEASTVHGACAYATPATILATTLATILAAILAAAAVLAQLDHPGDDDVRLVS